MEDVAKLQFGSRPVETLLHDIETQSRLTYRLLPGFATILALLVKVEEKYYILYHFRPTGTLRRVISDWAEHIAVTEVQPSGKNILEVLRAGEKITVTELPAWWPKLSEHEDGHVKPMCRSKLCNITVKSG